MKSKVIAITLKGECEFQPGEAPVLEKVTFWRQVPGEEEMTERMHWMPYPESAKRIMRALVKMSCEKGTEQCEK